MRISGFASGLDIDSMVKQLMTAQKAPLDKLNQQKQLTEWKRNDYRTVSSKIVSFQEKLNSLSLSSSIDAKKTNVSGAPNVLTATASGAASNAVLSVEVKSLATASTFLQQDDRFKGVAGNTTIKDFYQNNGVSNYNDNIVIGSTSIKLEDNETIDSLINKINTNKEANVTAIYDSASGSLSLTNRETGEKSLAVGGTFFDMFAGKKENKNGSNAIVTINGIETTQSSNRFTINGVELNLTGISPTGQTTRIEVVQDTDKMFDTIKSFVDSYNDVLSLLNNKTGEERYRTYLPLTKEQKADMSEDEIKLWEEKAKSGMLKNDSILSTALADMRTSLFADMTDANGNLLNLAQFGITTGGYTEKGKLIIDETKLRDAIANKSDELMSMFSTTNLTAKNDAYNETNGIFSRLKKISKDTLQTLSDRAGTSRYSSDPSAAFLPQSQIGDQLKDFDKRIADVNRRLALMENRYYKQFTAMETAMNKYNSISSSLTSMSS
ncbi:flagellar filament capping protein FliD [Paenibacillus sp. Marseille-Q4541]|uniref:flagellar filament capping protein FliD n=1 Tax=Paenibacillus sp. Marseille-Q4541 TaxID=2831522 RepID=UPI001BA7B055|nr:flagellar filament capping protein FliD [Paenibacillus sp. Marseille-Q4541]